MSHLLIIELPGGNDDDILQAAIDRGDRFTFLSGNLAHYRVQSRLSRTLDRASRCVEVSGFELGAVREAVMLIHRHDPIDAVLCLIDIRMVAASAIAEDLELPFIPPATASLLRDKYAVRMKLAESGLAPDPFALATTNEALWQAVEKVGLPALIKPCDGYGSQNVVILRDPIDLDPMLAPIDAMLPSNADYGLGVRANDRLLVERWLQGLIIGCDTMSFGGRHLLFGVNEKIFFEPPSFAIRGGSFVPAGPWCSGIERYAFSLLDAVGFEVGAAHIEMILTADGPRLIEINPRIVGAKIVRLVSMALGRPVYEDLIALHLGEGLPTLDGGTSNVAASRWLIAPLEGRIRTISLPSQTDGIRCVEMLRGVGDLVRPPFENADRLGYVMAVGPSREAAERAADDFVAGATVEVVPFQTAAGEVEPAMQPAAPA
jgi:hypothetical protein